MTSGFAELSRRKIMKRIVFALVLCVGFAAINGFCGASSEPVTREMADAIHKDRIYSNLDYFVSTPVTMLSNDQKVDLGAEKGTILVDQKNSSSRAIKISNRDKGEIYNYAYDPNRPNGDEKLEVRYPKSNIVLDFRRNAARNTYTLVSGSVNGEVYRIQPDTRPPNLSVRVSYKKGASPSSLRGALRLPISDNGGSGDGGSKNGGMTTVDRTTIRTADVGTANIGTADIGTADIKKADIGAADVGTADIKKADIGTSDIKKADIGTATIDTVIVTGRIDIRDEKLPPPEPNARLLPVTYEIIDAVEEFGGILNELDYYLSRPLTIVKNIQSRKLSTETGVLVVIEENITEAINLTSDDKGKLHNYTPFSEKKSFDVKFALSDKDIIIKFERKTEKDWYEPVSIIGLGIDYTLHSDGLPYLCIYFDHYREEGNIPILQGILLDMTYNSAGTQPVIPNQPEPQTPFEPGPSIGAGSQAPEVPEPLPYQEYQVNGAEVFDMPPQPYQQPVNGVEVVNMPQQPSQQPVNGTEVVNVQQPYQQPVNEVVLVNVPPAAPQEKPQTLDLKALPSSRNIMGTGALDIDTIVEYIQSNNNKVLTNRQIVTIVNAYIQEAQREQVNHDIAIAQMCYATNFLKYSVASHNYGGLDGARFPDMITGVRAHVQHLKGYASRELPRGNIVDPRFTGLVSSGIQGTVTTLDRLYTVWAPLNSSRYKNAIDNILTSMYKG